MKEIIEILKEIISEGIPATEMDEEDLEPILEKIEDVDTLYKLALIALLSRIEFLLAMIAFSKDKSVLAEIIKKLQEEERFLFFR